MQTLGKKIREERQRLGMTAREFARRIGVTPPHVTDIEADRRRPSSPLLARIADVLQMQVEELEALDTRLSPEVKEWMEERPVVSQLLRRLKDAPEADALLEKLQRMVERESKEKKGKE